MISENDVREAWGLPFSEFVRKIVPSVDPELFVERYVEAKRFVSPRPTPGAPELLAELSHLGILMIVVTSSSRRVITHDLETLGLVRYFDRVYGDEESQFHKPDPRVLSAPLAELGTQGYLATDMVIIGDSVSDCAMAYGNDLRFIGVLSGTGSRTDFEQMGVPADCIVEALTNLL